MPANNFLRSFWTMVLAFGLILATRPAAHADEILISAAASLIDVLKEIRSDYQPTSQHRLNFNFGPSSGLARQIEEGAPADIFFSADLAQMEKLERNGRLEPGSRKNLLSNQLVIIVLADSKLSLSTPQDLLKNEIKKLALAEPATVPVGVYTKTYLSNEALWDRIKSKVVPVQDVRATLAAVESGNVEAGFVYKTDAAVSRKVKIAYEVPIDKGLKITYPVAIVKDSKRKQAARDFLNYLQGPRPKAIFAKYGFIPLD